MGKNRISLLRCRFLSAALALFLFTAKSFHLQLRWAMEAVNNSEEEETTLTVQYKSNTGNNRVGFRFCNSTTRCDRIKLQQTKFSYVHISKNSGVSWIRELKRLKQVPEGLRGDVESMKKNFVHAGLYPIADSGAEHSIPFQDDLLKDQKPFHRLITLRSPRHQIWSMFSHCYYSKWGKKATKSNFPRNHPENDLLDFEDWLDHFLDDSKQSMLLATRNNTFKCYHPQNYQSRAFVVNHESPHTPNEIFQPDLKAVIDLYWSFDWVGLTAFFHESKCILYYRLDTEGTPFEIAQMVQHYLDTTCLCGVEGQNETTGDLGLDVKMIHADKGHRNTLLDMPDRVLKKIDLISQVDSILYETALAQFLKEVVWLESKLERRILCDPVINKWDRELSFLSLSLNDTYDRARQIERIGT